MLGLSFCVAQEGSPNSGCQLAHEMYTCNLAEFQQILANAKTAKIETGPVDPFAQTQLKKLFVALGKSAPAEDQPADLTFLLIPIDPNAVRIGGGETQVATLRVFARGSGSGRGDLVWVENFSAQEDLPWPAVVNRLIGQFRNRFHVH